MYVLNRDSNSISVIQSLSDKVVRTISVNSLPDYRIYDPANNELYITYESLAAITVINCTSNMRLTTFLFSNPPKLFYDPANKEVYVANYGNTVSTINSTTNQVIANITVGLTPFYIMFDPANKQMFVPNLDSGTVSAISGNKAGFFMRRAYGHRIS